MRKRLRIISIVVMVLLLGLFALHQSAKPEPSYQGRSLTQWLDEYDVELNAIGVSGMAMEPLPSDALKQIGTNAIPFLLKKLASSDTNAGRHFKSWVNSHSWIRFRFPDLAHVRATGFFGFIILGSDAMTAVPALAKLTEHHDEEVRWRALQSLSQVKPKQEIFLPILLRTSQDGSSKIRSASVYMLESSYPEEAKRAASKKLFPELIPAPTNRTPTNAPVGK